jgi:ligand-binding sensor domain-containing protein
MKSFSVVSILMLLMLSIPLQAQSNQDAWDLVTGGELAINDMVLDAKDNSLWIGTTDGLWRYDGRLAEQWDIQDTSNVRSLLIDAQNQLWIGTMRGLVVLGSDRRWDQRREPFPDLVDPVRILTLSATNGIWAGTDNGVFHRSRAR